MKEMICIVCPRGCRLSVTDKQEITGNFCKRGETYALQELTCPKRMITSTVALESQSGLRRLPVITSQEVPKDRIMEVMAILQKVIVKAPIKMHDVIIHNVLGLSIDVIATREVLK